MRIDKDGNDVQTLGSFLVSTYIDCVQLCLANSQCRYIVKSGNVCYLKQATPSTSKCATNDECAVVLGIFCQVT